MAKKELDTVQNSAAEVEENVVVLHKPLADGTDKLVLDFERINGRTLISCEKQARSWTPLLRFLFYPRCIRLWWRGLPPT